MIERRFNHDLLIDPEDQDAARTRWPAIAHALIDAELLERFSPHEAQAKTNKKRVHWLGSIAVIFMVTALGGAAVSLRDWRSQVAGVPSLVGIALDLCGIAGLVIAGLASRFGPFRRRWLMNRFLTECLRRWHFQRLITGRYPGGAAPPDPDRPGDDPSPGTDFQFFLQGLDGSVGPKMDGLRERGADPLGDPVRPVLPSDPSARRQLLDAFKVLRLDHQFDHAAYKLSPDDRTFAGLSIAVLTSLTDLLAGTSLSLALVFSFIQFVQSQGWMSLVGVLLAILGVGVRAWRDGMGLIQEVELYQEMHHRLELLRERWSRAKADREFEELMEEVDEVSVEELRMFLGVHERAQFLF